MVDREHRLRDDRSIRETRKAGKAFADRALVARIAPNPVEPLRNRFSVIAGKKIGKAHTRNRCKRLVREAIRHLQPHLHQGFNIVIVLRGGEDELPNFWAAYDSLLTIAKRARLLASEPTEPPIPRPAAAPTRNNRGDAS